MSAEFFAHSTTGPITEWEPLLDHLSACGARAAEFAAAFDSRLWGELAGVWHDVGKYRAEFQRRIHGERLQAPHAGLGATLAHARGAPLAAFAIAGHHTGLANRASQGETKQNPVERVVAENARLLDEIMPVIPPEIAQQPIPELPQWLILGDADDRKLRLEFWTRFLFSVLVDADYLVTEAFYDPEKRARFSYDEIVTLRTRLDERLDRFQPDTPVNRLRATVLRDCRRAAEHPPGLFSLTVPTGGGKTFSAMSFALRHAERHGLRRIIVVAPYTSIIEQNAEVYRQVLGDINVVEHHSAIDQEERERNVPEHELLRRLAVENWDAPIIVTTAVQFFESLFSNAPSRCRKLHNVARSVIVVDEAQTIPTDFLLTMIDGMRQLTAHYGCSLVLSTATQPALGARGALPKGLADVREIVADPTELASSLRRVSVQWSAPGEQTSHSALAPQIAKHTQVLAIVHSRRDARELAGLLPKEGRFHLSRLMCAAHRLATFAAIRKALSSRATCRIVSTQIIEAGVDLDLPVVYRAMAGLDSLAQAAGRCNRNGLLQDEHGNPRVGMFIVFRAESLPPAGVLRRGLAVAEEMLSASGAVDIADPSTIHEYFRKLYLGSQLDRRGVMAERREFNFATVAERVRFIADAGRPVVVPWGDSVDRVRAYERAIGWAPGEMRRAARALQPFVVEVREVELQLLERQGAVVPLEGFGHVIVPSFLKLYDEEFGLILDENAEADAGALII